MKITDKINETKEQINELDTKYMICRKLLKPCSYAELNRCDNCNHNHEKRVVLSYELQRLNRIEVPTEYIDAELSEEIKQLFFENRNIWLFGESGLGKTRAGYALYIESRINKIDCSLIVESEIIKDWERYKDIDILIIDDIGTELNKFRLETAYSNYFYLIDYRCKNNKKTVYTSKYNISAWLSQIAVVNNELSTSIKSRLSSFFAMKKFEGEDKRIKF